MSTVLVARWRVGVCLLLLALSASVQPAWSQSRTLPDAPGTWKAWKPFSAVSSARTERGATPAEVKAFEATLLELNAILRRAPGVATPRGYSVETWGYLSGFGLPVPGKPTGKSLPLAGALNFGAFPIFEYERNGKTIREDTGETALMLFQVNDPWVGRGRGPEEWGTIETDAFMQPKPKGEVAGIPLYGDMLVIAKSPESLWSPVPLGAALDLVVVSRRADVASVQESLEKFKARLAVVRDPAWRAQRMKEAKEAAAQMPNPEVFIASIESAVKIEETSLAQEIGPAGGTGKGLVQSQLALDEVTTWLAELSSSDRAAPACYAAEAKGLRARFRPGPAAGCVAVVRPNYQYFNAALRRSAPQVVTITPVARCFDTANKHNSDATSTSPAGCAANRALVATMDKDAIRAWLR
jgi:hypothetical protein